MTAHRPYQQTIYSVAAYLEMEAKAVEKHEYHNGKIVKMAGGTLNHNLLSMNFGTAVNIALDQTNKDCLVLSSDMKIHIPTENRFVYPDLTVICDAPTFYKTTPNILTNPLLVVEVLSDSTEGYDRGLKFNQYSLLDSFREYVLVTQHTPQVDIWFLEDEERKLWKHTVVEDLEGMVTLDSIGITLSMQAIYKRINFEVNEEEEQAEQEDGKTT